MFERRGASRGRKWSAAALLLAAAALRAEDSGKPTNREQLKQFHESWVAAGRPSPGATSVRKEWGIDDSDIVNVHAYEFQANTSTDLINDDGNGYRFFGAPAVPYMAAPVRLPSGALINALSISYCAVNDGDLVAALYDNGTGGGGGGGGTLIAGPVVAGAGCGVIGVPADYTYASNFGHPLYLVVHFAGEATDGTIKFNNVGVRYRRQVSPAPLTASFADVPTDDFGFQHIEALASSGITGGCGGSNYCPDSPVTRRQMAIFLAKALGLHWAAD
jgi:S-layer homology domain